MAFISEPNIHVVDNARVLKRLWKILNRNWLLILFTYLIIVTGSYATISLVSNVYESSAQLLVKLGRENTQVPITVEKGDVYSTGVQKEEIHSYMRLLSSDEIIDEAIDKLGLERFAHKPEKPRNLIHLIKLKLKEIAKYSKAHIDAVLIKVGLKTSLTEREKIFILMKRNLRVNREKDSNVISVSIRLPDPGLAQDAVKTIIETYQAHHIRLNKGDNILAVFDDQAALYKQELIQKETEIEGIKQQWHLSIPNIQIQGLVESIQALNMTKNMQLTQKQKLLVEKRVLQQQLEGLPKTQEQAKLIGQSPSSLLMKEELAGLKIKLAKVSKLYTAQSQVTTVLTDRISDLESVLHKDKSQVTSGVTYQPNPLTEEVAHKISHATVELSGIDASIKSINENIKQLETEIKEYRQGENILNMLEREYSILEQKFLTNATRSERVKLEHALDANNIANIKILSAANYPVKPASPRKLMLMGIGGIFGLLASIGLAMLRHWLLDKVYDGDDIHQNDDFVFLGNMGVEQN